MIEFCPIVQKNKTKIKIFKKKLQVAINFNFRIELLFQKSFFFFVDLGIKSIAIKLMLAQHENISNFCLYPKI